MESEDKTRQGEKENGREDSASGPEVLTRGWLWQKGRERHEQDYLHKIDFTVCLSAVHSEHSLFVCLFALCTTTKLLTYIST